MALHNLKITVIDGGKRLGADEYGSTLGGKGEKGGEKTGKDSLLYKVLNYNSTLKDSVKKAVSPTTFFAVQAGINLATQTGRQFINYYVSDIGRKHGDSNYQAIVNRQIERYTDAASFATGALSGAAAGSLLGPGGVAVGAAVGAISAGVSLGFRQAGRERAYQHEIFQESNNQAYNVARAGNTALTGRLR